MCALLPRGVSRPTSILRVVVLPAPLGPKSPQISPSCTSKESSLSAVTPAMTLDQIVHLDEGLCQLDAPLVGYSHLKCSKSYVFVPDTHKINPQQISDVVGLSRGQRGLHRKAYERIMTMITSEPRGVAAKHAGLWTRRPRFESGRGYHKT